MQALGQQEPATLEMKGPTPSRRHFWARWLLPALIVAFFGAFYFLGFHEYASWDFLRSHLDDLQELVQQHLAAALLITFVLYVAIAALSLPIASPLSLVIGSLFGRWLGTALVSSASTVGACLCFLGSRFLFHDLVQQRFSARLAVLNAGIERDGAFYLFALRLAPIFPFFLINLGMGLTQIRLRTFAWVSWLGMLPGTFLYVNAGAELGRVNAPSEVLSATVIVSLILLAVVPLILHKLLKWMRDLRSR